MIHRTAARSSVLCTLFALVLAACGGGDPPGTTVGPNGEKLGPDGRQCTRFDLHARAGPDQSVGRNDFVELDGTDSLNADLWQLSYRWSVEGPSGPVTLAYPSMPGISFQAKVPGLYTVSLVVEDGCGKKSDPDVALVRVTNAAPVANAGPDGTIHKRAALELDGSATKDPDWDGLVYTWAVVSGPPGAHVTFSRPDEDRTDFSADVAGDYVLSLTADDGFAKGTDTVAVQVTNTVPVASVVAPAEGSTELAIALASTGTTDQDQDALSYQWSVVAPPSGANFAFSDPTSASPTFTTDLEGSYTLQLVVHDGTVPSAPAQVTVAISRFVQRLTHDVDAAAYSNGLVRLVLVSDTPEPALYLYDPIGRTEQKLALPRAPTGVGLSPDGTTAAVGDAEGKVQLVNLTSLTLGSTITLPMDNTWNPPRVMPVGRVLLTATRLYAFPTTGSGFGRVHTVDISTPTPTLVGSSNNTYSAPKASLDPSGTATVYALVPNAAYDLVRFKQDRQGILQADVSVGSTIDQRTGEDAWFISNNRFLTGVGAVFGTTPGASTDFAYVGLLGGYPGGYEYPILSSSRVGTSDLVASIPGQHGYPYTTDDTLLQLHKPSTLALLSTVPLPHFVEAGKGRKGHGRFVFHDADGSHRFVVLRASEADSSSWLSDDYGIVTY